MVSVLEWVWGWESRHIASLSAPNVVGVPKYRLRVLSWLYGADLRLCVCSPAFTRSIPSSDFATIRLIIVSFGFWLTQLGCGANLIFSFLVWICGIWCWCSPCVCAWFSLIINNSVLFRKMSQVFLFRKICRNRAILSYQKIGQFLMCFC